MMKVKILHAVHYPDLEEKVNDFINRNDVGPIYDIKFSGHAVLIRYEDIHVPQFFET